ncbi:MAG: hypothetical protein C4341_05175 [Armatimonadota bacterium]
MKLLVPILAAIIVIGGTTIGLGYAGVINIPGITPPKKVKSTAKQVDGEQAANPTSLANERLGQQATDDAKTKAKSDSPISDPATPTTEETRASREQTSRQDGTERLAKLWTAMDAQKVAALVQQWKDGDVLLVLAKMDDEKLAEVLSALPPERALKLSRGIKALERGGK